jgi:tetratricopeptide (TPR) repeat protein
MAFFYVLVFAVLTAIDVYAADRADTSVKSIGTDIPDYVGLKKCRNCHSKQAELWQGSHHDLAMQHATDESVLGNFSNIDFKYAGITSKFFKDENKFIVRTDGADGKLHDFEIKYTFGVSPLQQYLVEFPGGRLQALSIAWDTRPADQGGQRWFHLYPDEAVTSTDELHWTGLNQNWNYMCADCHSTNVRKNYDLATKKYDTTWSEINVSCEACHGPGSNHVLWATKGQGWEAFDNKSKGLTHQFNERQGVSWRYDPKIGQPVRSSPRSTEIEIQGCATCHARRVQFFEDDRIGQPLMDDYLPSLLDAGLYHVDGQIEGEVYEYGSFIQSRMYHAGVTCSDCHEPHSLSLRKPGNGVCLQCHTASTYDTNKHHFHTQGNAGSRCVNCHMPAKKFMVIDARRDHSLRIPRPDLSVSLRVPNACTQCHTDKTYEWAGAALKKRHNKSTKRHYGVALYAGRHGLPNAEQLLTELIMDDTQPAIARATAVKLLPRYLSQQSAPVLQMAAHDEQPLVGLGLASVLDSIPMQYRQPFAVPLLYDDMRTTRSLAAAALVGSSFQGLPADTRTQYNQALNEYLRSQLNNADRPESLVNLADIYARQGQAEKAEQFYRNAISLAPYYTPAYINLADFYRNSGNDSEGEKVLQSALSRVRDKAVIHHALGLLRVRQKKLAEAIDDLRLAAESPTATERYVYVYAIALHSSGKAQQALQILKQAQQNYPASTDILYALISINNELGNQKQAQYYEGLLRKRH